MDLTKFKIKEVHISIIKHGDTILHVDGIVKTVSICNIKRGFCGIALFGDSYRMGTMLVKKILI